MPDHTRRMLEAPMRLLRIPEPFDHPDWIFEPKLELIMRRYERAATLLTVQSARR